MVFQQTGVLPKAQKGGMTRSRVAKSRRDKRALVEKGLSHGILVYSGREPVGWCQYGTEEELPRIDAGTIYRKFFAGGEDNKLWRITCFWVDRKHRRRGVAAAALKAALGSIRKQGGGLVEAYPAVSKGFPADWPERCRCSRRKGSRSSPPTGSTTLW
jgi:ribosomal protein S18 acetylase RimI-like enzyme